MFNSLFRLDGPFHKYGSLVFDLFMLNMLWVITGGPFFALLALTTLGTVLNFYVVLMICLVALFGCGAATTALYYVCLRRVNDDDGYMFKEFFKSYKENFVQATGVWVIIMGIGLLLMFNIFNAKAYGSLANILLPMQFAIVAELIFVSIYIFPLLARFHMKTKQLFKTAFIMANKHFLTTITSVVVVVGMFYIIDKFHKIFLFFLVSGCIYLISMLLNRVFKKYDDEDKSKKQEYIDEEKKSNKNESISRYYNYTGNNDETFNRDMLRDRVENKENQD